MSSEFQRYDFFDFGASKGGSIELAKNLFGAHDGLGIDIDPAKVDTMRNAGYDCLQGDITQLDLPADSVRFVIISHLLEHLADEAMVEATLSSAARVASDFIFIQGPFFDEDDYLEQAGLKFYWSDWSGHPCHLTTGQLRNILDGLGLRDYVMLVRRPVVDSADSAIHPLDSPRNQHAYDAEIHPPKPHIEFDRSLYREILCLVRLRPFADWDVLLEKVRANRKAVVLAPTAGITTSAGESPPETPAAPGGDSRDTTAEGSATSGSGLSLGLKRLFENPKPEPVRQLAWDLVCILAIVILALVSRFPQDPDRFFWGDEAWRAFFIYETDSLSDIPSMSHRTRGWLQLSEYVSGKLGIVLFGDLSLALLFWPLLWSLLAVAGCYVLLRRISGRSAALLGSLLIAAGPGFILHSREFKPFVLDLALTLWALVAAVALRKQHSRRDYWMTGLLSIFAVSSLVFAFVYPAVVLYRVCRARALRWPTLALYSVPGGLFVVYYFFFLGAQNLSRSTGHRYFTPLYLTSPDHIPTILTTGAHSIGYFIVAGWLLTTVVYFVVMPLVSHRRGDFLYLLFLVPLLAQIGASMLGKFPLFSRPTTYLYGIMIVSLAYGIDGLLRELADKRRRALAAVALAALAAASVWTTGPGGWKVYRKALDHPHDPGKKAFQELASRFRPGDHVKFGFGHEYIFHVHKKEAFQAIPEIMSISTKEFTRRHRLPDRSPARLCSHFRRKSRDLKVGDRVWILTRRLRSYSDFLPSLGRYEVVLEEPLQGLLMLELTRSPRRLECP